MDRLVPADEESNPFLDADLGPEPELPAGAPQVGVREPHVPRLVAVALDPHRAAERASDQLDQPIQPHPGASADVDGLGDAAGPGTLGPGHGRQDPVDAIRHIGIVALVRPHSAEGDPSIARPGTASRADYRTLSVQLKLGSVCAWAPAPEGRTSRRAATSTTRDLLSRGSR